MPRLLLVTVFLLLWAAEPVEAQVSRSQADGPTVVPATHVSTSEPLRDMTPIPHQYRSNAPFVVPERFPYRFDSQPTVEMRRGLVDPVLDAPSPNTRRAGPGTVFASFSGTPVANTAPPDPTGEIGPNHYVQMVNSRLAVYDRAGTILLAPVNNNQIWQGAGGLCEVNNDGDPIVLYDESADRWLISQFVSANGPDAICVAISATPDPTGSWHRYEFGWPEGFPDYPKFGIWPTGYALTTSTFPDLGGSLSQAVMLERDQMLIGAAAQSIRFDITGEYYSMLPADFNGPAPPPGTPALFAGLRLSSATPADREVIRLYALTPDWTTPSNSTFSNIGNLPVAPFDVYSLFSRSTAIPQLGTADRVAALGHRPMMQLQYRNFGGVGRLLFNHTIAVSGVTTRTGVRWYELRDGGSGTWSVYQEGTYAPSDDHFRWNGSMAMNDAGAIGLAYSVSSSTMFPSIRFTGQTLAASGSGVMDVAETEIIAGTGSQTSTANRWGDYSHLSVDPTDGTTFWYTNLYYETVSSWNWKTNISRFGFNAVPPNPPEFVFLPNAISATLAPDGTTAALLTVSNTADEAAEDLIWTAAIQNAAPSLTGNTGPPPGTEAEGPAASNDPSNAADGANDPSTRSASPAGWVTSSPASGTTPRGASSPITLEFDATGLTEGTYTAELVFVTNAPTASSGILPITLTVTGSNVVSGPLGWRLLSSPAAGLTVDDLATMNLVQGMSGYYPPPEAYPNLFTSYDGTTYVSATGTGQVLQSGMGFWWYFYDVDLTPGGASNSYELPITLATTKPAPTTDQVVTVHSTGDGFNMLGNPFGVSLDVSNMTGWPGAKAVLASFVAQIWDSSNSTFVTSATNPTIAAWQGFFAEGIAAGSLTIPERARTTGGVLQRSGSAFTDTKIAFELQAADGPQRDRAAVLVLGEGRGEGADLGDATKLQPLSSEYVQLAFATAGGGAMRAVESRPLDAVSVPLTVASVGAGSNMVLTWPRVQNLPDGWAAVLQDLETGETVDLSSEAQYAFEISPSAARAAFAPSAARASARSARFNLTVGPRSVASETGTESVLSLEAPRPNPATSTTRLDFNLAQPGPVRLAVVDIQGREVAVVLDEDRPAGAGMVLLDASALASGVYVVRLDTGSELATRRLVVVTR